MCDDVCGKDVRMGWQREEVGVDGWGGEGGMWV